MIEIYTKGNKIRQITFSDGVDNNINGVLNVRITNYTQTELEQIAKHFNLQLTSFYNRDDIEISSHYVDLEAQLSINLSIPSYQSENALHEQFIHIIIKDEVVFVFIPSDIDDRINLLTKFRYDFDNMEFNSHLDLLAFQIGIISDYYADIVESISKKIKDFFYNTLKSNNFTEKELDRLSELNFSNFLLRESVSEFQQIIQLLRKKFFLEKKITKKLTLEITDLQAISEHIQNNFDRITDLKSNISSKIELEQNRIFKMLTIITISISLPTLIAGIYGMNFNNMPELDFAHGYPIVLCIILLSFILPYVYFKRKKWF